MGIGESLRNAAATGALVMRQRLELAALDVEEQGVVLARLIGGALAVAVLAGLTLAAIGAAIVIVLWDVARIAAVVGVALAYLALTVIAWQRLLRAWAAKPPFMQATLAELERDRQELAAP